jgi:triphosphatase
MQDRREIEWQLEAPDPERLAARLEALVAEGALLPPRSRRITDLYLDTADWRLYRAGYALRLRSAGRRDEATIKSLAACGGDGLRDRREISEPLPGPDVRLLRGAVGRRVRALAGRRRLRALFRVETERTSYAVSLDGRQVGTLELDAFRVLAGDGAAALLRRVEVEADPGVAARELEGFVRRLREDAGLSPAGFSKYEAGLRAAGLAPPEPPDLGSEEPGPSPALGELAFAALRSQMRRFLAHEPGTRLGEDPEELHDMRVACRRLRAALRIFEEALPARAGRLRRELGWIGGVLGEVRDLDALLGLAEGWVAGAPPEDRGPLLELRRALEERREKAHRRMLRALDSRRYSSFVEEFCGFLRRGPSGRVPGAARPALQAAPDLVRRQRRRVRGLGKRLGPGSPPKDYHRLRRRARRLRYAVEFFSGLYGQAAEDYVSALKGLQDLLGEHQDAEVAAQTLRRLAREGRGISPEAAFVAGEISRCCKERARELRKLFPRRYAGIGGRPWKQLRDEMERRRPES